MGAFWDAWNKQGQVNDQAAMSQIQQIGGLAGLMQKAQEQQTIQGIKGLLASDAPDDQKIKGLLAYGPQGVQIANQMTAMQEHQQKVAKAKRVEDFWKNEAPKFNTPAQPGLMGNATPGEGLTQRTGGLMSFSSGTAEDDGPQGMLSPPKPAGVDLEGLLNRGAQVGAVNPEALVNHRAQVAQREADRQTRIDSLRVQIAERNAARQDSADLRRELADMQAQNSRDNIRLAASLRPAPQPSAPVVVPDGRGGYKYVSREDAIGQPAPAPSADIRVDAGAKTWAAREVKNFKADPEVKRFESFAPPVEAIAPYMTRMAKPGATSDNVEDLNLTKLYLGITQQKGERLTNMDKKGLSALAPLDSRFGNAISSFLNGKDLTDDVRKGMWKTVVGQMATLQQVKDARKTELLKRAEANKVDKALLFGSTEE